MKWFDIFRPKSASKEIPESKLERASEIQDKLLKDRIIFLGTPIDDTAANEVIAELLYLEAESPTTDINLYINSPGGAVSSTFAIYDTIKAINADVTTICVGQASGTAALLVASGARGKRFALPSSRFLINRLRMGGNADSMDDIITRENELERLRRLLIKTFVEETGKSPKLFVNALRNEVILSVHEAIKYGLIDAIIEKK